MMINSFNIYRTEQFGGIERERERERDREREREHGGVLVSVTVCAHSRDHRVKLIQKNGIIHTTRSLHYSVL